MYHTQLFLSLEFLGLAGFFFIEGIGMSIKKNPGNIITEFSG